MTSTSPAPVLHGREAARAVAGLLLPPVGAGVIARRRSAMRVLERLQADRHAAPTLQRLRERHGPGPVQVSLMGRRIAIVLEEDDVRRVLDGAPDPFHPAMKEKRGALGHFQPRAVLATRGPVRARRRDANERALDMDLPLHHLADRFVHVLREELLPLTEQARSTGSLTADDLVVVWWRAVRRITLGDAARDDEAVTDELHTLRSNGNWSLFHPQRRRLRDRFTGRIQSYLDDAAPDSLIGALAALEVPGDVDPAGQVPHWLFAFDAAGLALCRAVALLATHDDVLEQARTEVDATDPTTAQTYPWLRAVVLEAVRLWPTTPAILRDSTEPTTWTGRAGDYEIPAGTGFLVQATAFHRDRERLPFADRLDPEIWLDGRADQHPQLVPFSAGPARCPGQNVVLLTIGTALATLVAELDLDLVSTPRMSPDEPLPATLDHFTLRFAARARS